MKVVLIGFMGTGKTTVGKLLAEKLKWPFYDIDEMIAQDIGMSIPQIFEKKGEPFFRDTETAMISMLSPLDRCVISTGGGAVLREENKQALKRNSVVVHLVAEEKTLLGRLGNASGRPLFPPKNTSGELAKLLAERQAHYQAIQTISLATDQAPPERVVEQILAHLGPGQ